MLNRKIQSKNGNTFIAFTYELIIGFVIMRTVKDILKMSCKSIRNTSISNIPIYINIFGYIFLNLAFQVFQNSGMLLFIKWWHISSDILFLNKEYAFLMPSLYLTLYANLIVCKNTRWWRACIHPQIMPENWVMLEPVKLFIPKGFRHCCGFRWMAFLGTV